MSPSHAQRIARDRTFERLYRRHRRDVYGAVLRDVRDPAEAEDVTQIAFLNAFRAIRRGEQPEKPRAWLVTIARNVVRRRYKARATRPQEVALDPELAADLSDLEGPTVGEIAAAIRRLPPNQRAVILLREIQGRTYAEIAEELELSVPAVETLIFRARRSLSERLKLIDQVPTTQERPRRLRGFLALPLPGLGKFSFGFSAGRAAMAAFVGSVAVVTVPVGDVAADPPHAAIVQRAPSIAERVELRGTTLRATETRPARNRDARDKRDTRPDKGAPSPADSGGGAQDLLPSVEAPVPVSPVPVPSVPLPTLPPLPVEPPALPPIPPPPDTDLLG